MASFNIIQNQIYINHLNHFFFFLSFYIFFPAQRYTFHAAFARRQIPLPLTQLLNSLTDTTKILNIRQQNKAFLDTTKSLFLLPLDSSPNRKSSDGRFCHTSPVKLKICSCPMQFLDVPRSFRSLHVRFWRPQANRNLRHPWVESEMPIS